MEADVDAQRKEASKRTLEDFHRYNEYLKQYYNDEEIKVVSSSIRGLVQEWMADNRLRPVNRLISQLICSIQRRD